MRYLKKDQIAVIKLNQEKILELVREELFSRYQDFAEISNVDIISFVCNTFEDDGTISILAAFQPTKGRLAEPNFVCADTLMRLNEKQTLTENSVVYTVDELRKIISSDNSE